MIQETIANELSGLASLKIHPPSIVTSQNAAFGVVFNEDGLQFVALGSADALMGFEGVVSEYAGKSLLIGPANASNIAQLRTVFPWLRPEPLGLHTSAGLGDRLGLATPGHVRAIRAFGGKVAPIFPQQSIREMTRTARTPQQVMDEATWGVFAEGWKDGFGADADHLKTPTDIDNCLAAGFTFFTIDPGEYVDNTAAELNAKDLRTAFEALPWEKLEDKPDVMRRRYLDRTLDLDGFKITINAHDLLQAAVKYGKVIAHVLMMYRHLVKTANGRSFEMEISVDETEQPTSHLEHIYIVSELKRLNVRWISLAPRYIGRFEKGVDYIGDLAAFESDFAAHAAIARLYGPYKLSLHSGSDKFSIYPIAARQANGLVHLKTAGTSYLEALRTLAAIDPLFFRSIYEFSLGRYEIDKASYHVSGELDRAPKPADLTDQQLPSVLDQFDARQILHVTFGSVLTTRKADGDLQFYNRFMQLLRSHPDLYADNLETHFRRHISPFVLNQG